MPFFQSITVAKAKVNVKADVKVYLIPSNEFKTVDGKPVLDDKYLVYDSTKSKPDNGGHA